jgi:hypothetical protein
MISFFHLSVKENLSGFQDNFKEKNRSGNRICSFIEEGSI